MIDVLFLCTANSARSVLAEAYLNATGKGRFRAFSAGSRPAGEVNPFALRLLVDKGISTAGLRSKSWDEFGSSRFDIILTVCDNAARETCPVWPGRPVTAHWGICDPAAVIGSDEERRNAFAQALTELGARIDALVALPVEKLDPTTLRRKLEEIA